MRQAEKMETEVEMITAINQGMPGATKAGTGKEGFSRAFGGSAALLSP